MSHYDFLRLPRRLIYALPAAPLAQPLCQPPYPEIKDNFIARNFQLTLVCAAVCRVGHMCVLRALHVTLPQWGPCWSLHTEPCQFRLKPSVNLFKPHKSPGVGGGAHHGTWDHKARSRGLSSCPDWGMCGRRGHRWVPGGWILAGQMSRQQSIPTISPSQCGPRQGRAEATSLGERESPVQGQESSPGQAMAIAVPLPWPFLKGRDLAEDEDLLEGPT